MAAYDLESSGGIHMFLHILHNLYVLFSLNSAYHVQVTHAFRMHTNIKSYSSSHF